MHAFFSIVRGLFTKSYKSVVINLTLTIKRIEVK
jgi:hypothetical protein